MKKTFFLLLSALVFISSHAQDTITENDTCYIFWPHSLPLEAAHNSHMDCRGSIIWENVVTADTWIYGIALRGDFPLDSTVKVWLTKNIKDSVPFYSDTAYIDIYAIQNYFKCEARQPDFSYPPSEHVDKCNEIYFHRPWLMQDTFYVRIEYGDYDRSPYVNLHNLTMPALDTVYPQRYSLLTPVGWSDFMPTQPGYASSWGQEFPILEPNRTRCHKPTGLHLTDRGDTWAVLAWNGGAGDSYRVTVEGPDSTFVVETTDTSVLLQPLTPDASYRVEVQSLCHYQYYDFDSSFLNPGHAHMGFRTFSDGVTSPDANQQIDISPNPASHTVDITSSLPITGIELTDVLGHKVSGFQTPHSEFKVTLDLTAYPRGTYLLRILTPAGPTTKKLLIQ